VVLALALWTTAVLIHIVITFIIDSLLCFVLMLCNVVFLCAVYVFDQKDSKYAYKTEIRSCLEHSSRPASTLWVNMMARGGQVSNSLFAVCTKWPSWLVLVSGVFDDRHLSLEQVDCWMDYYVKSTLWRLSLSVADIFTCTILMSLYFIICYFLQHYCVVVQEFEKCCILCGWC